MLMLTFNFHVFFYCLLAIGADIASYEHESVFIKHAHGFGELNISLWLVQLKEFLFEQIGTNLRNISKRQIVPAGLKTVQCQVHLQRN